MHNWRKELSLLLIIMCQILLVLMLSSCGEAGEIPATTVIPLKTTEIAILPEDTQHPISSLTFTPQLLPDLVVESISVEWEIFDDCFDLPSTAIYQVNIQIANTGEADAGSFRTDITGYWEEISFKELRQGERTTLVFDWIDLDLDVGETIEVSVDDEDKVLESDEDNNYLGREISAPKSIPSCPTTSEPTPCPEPVPIPLLPPDQQVNFETLHMINTTTGWAVAGVEDDDEHILRSDDGGRSWQDVTPPQLPLNCGQYPFHATGYFYNAEVAWVTYYEPWYGLGPYGIWRTLDGGETWELSPFLQRDTGTFGGFFTWPIIEFVDSQHGWVLIDYFLGAGSHGSELFRTTDGGKSWELIPELYLTHGNGLDFIDRMHGWETSNNPIVIYMGFEVTNDGGYTWEFQELPYPSELLDVEESDPFSCDISLPRLGSSQTGSVVVQCERDYFMYNTTDDGQTWKGVTIPGGPPEFINSMVGWAIEPPVLVGADADETQMLDLYQTEDGGQTWRQVTTVDWYGHMNFVDEKVGWAVAESGDETVLMHTTDGGRTWEQLIPRTVSYEVAPPIDITPQLFLPAELQPITPGNAHGLEVVAEVPAENATRLAFHPNGAAVFIAHGDGTLTQWMLEGISHPSVAKIQTDWMYDLDVSLDGQWMAMASKDGTLMLEGLWGYQGIPTNDLQTILTDDREVTSVAFSPIENILASGSEDSMVRIWRYSKWGMDTELLNSLAGHTGWVWDVAFSTDGMTLASASSDRTVRLWERESWEELFVLRGHTSTVRRVAFSPDGQLLASASWDGTLKLWDVNTGQELHTLRQHDGWVNDVAFSSDGELLASGSADGLVILWDPDDGDVLGVLSDHNSGVGALVFSPDGRLLATVSEDGKLRFWGVIP
jgi:photosystem II stability/assembly factor-like uncharacterized protein